MCRHTREEMLRFVPLDQNEMNELISVHASESRRFLIGSEGNGRKKETGMRGERRKGLGEEKRDIERFAPWKVGKFKVEQKLLQMAITRSRRKM